MDTCRADAKADAVQTADAAQERLDKLIGKREDTITKAKDKAVLAILNAEEAAEAWALAFTVFEEANVLCEAKVAVALNAKLPLAALNAVTPLVEKVKATAKTANAAKRVAESMARKEDAAVTKVKEAGMVYMDKIALAIVDGSKAAVKAKLPWCWPTQLNCINKEFASQKL